MVLVIRGNRAGLRKAGSLFVSAAVHGSMLAWVAFGPALSAPSPRRSLYDQMIRPDERRIIWYNLRERLPDVNPAPARKELRPPRARTKSAQTIVAGARDDARPPQLIWSPAPRIDLPKPIPLPNVLAVAPTAAHRAFTPPPEKIQPRTAPQIPEAPRISASVELKQLSLPAPAAPHRAFALPAGTRREQAKLEIPEAPRVATGTELHDLALPTQAAPYRTFTAPVERRDEPARDAVVASAPAISEAAVPAEAELAIVGLNPANTTELPSPPPSHAAGFSAGPKPGPKEGEPSASGGAMLSVPGLLARGGGKSDQPALVARLSPNSRETQLAAERMTRGAPPAESPGLKTAPPPDPRLAGRVVYVAAIQMPNTTSYMGSWIVWFAEHEPAPGGPGRTMQAPVPTHKVDPKYIPAAAAERVEGRVRLFAVIRKDGRVDSIALLKHVDVRLDTSAMEALGKWVFEPARRDGTPVDVDAVFEIPFQLAPRPAK